MAATSDIRLCSSKLMSSTRRCDIRDKPSRSTMITTSPTEFSTSQVNIHFRSDFSTTDHRTVLIPSAISQSSHTLAAARSNIAAAYNHAGTSTAPPFFRGLLYLIMDAILTPPASSLPAVAGACARPTRRCLSWLFYRRKAHHSSSFTAVCSFNNSIHIRSWSAGVMCSQLIASIND